MEQSPPPSTLNTSVYLLKAASANLQAAVVVLERSSQQLQHHPTLADVHRSLADLPLSSAIRDPALAQAHAASLAEGRPNGKTLTTSRSVLTTTLAPPPATSHASSSQVARPKVITPSRTSGAWRNGMSEQEILSRLHLAPAPPGLERGGSPRSHKEDVPYLTNFLRWVCALDPQISVNAMSRLCSQWAPHRNSESWRTILRKQSSIVDGIRGEFEGVRGDIPIRRGRPKTGTHGTQSRLPRAEQATGRTRCLPVTDVEKDRMAKYVADKRRDATWGQHGMKRRGWEDFAQTYPHRSLRSWVHLYSYSYYDEINDLADAYNGKDLDVKPLVVPGDHEPTTSRVVIDLTGDDEDHEKRLDRLT